MKELNLNEKEYRGVELPSYSLLKAIDESGPRAIINRKEIEGESVEFGSLLDCLLLTPEEFHSKFYFQPIEKPTAQLLQLANAVSDKFLYEGMEIDPKSIECLDLIFDTIKELNLFGNTKDIVKIREKFDNELFWNYLRAKYDSRNKVIFSPEAEQEAYQAISILKNHEKTKHLFVNNKKIEYLSQVKLIGVINGKEVKVMLDKVAIDHNKKTITPYDLKATEFRQRSFPYTFRKMKYYLQASLYHYVLVQWAKEKYPDYIVEEFKFLVYSRSDRYPFVWVVSDTWLNDGYYGFTDYKNDKQKGVEELLNEYYFYVNTARFEIEKEFIENSELYIY